MKYAVLVAVIFLAGCSYTCPSDQQVFTKNASNARAMNTKIQGYTFTATPKPTTANPNPVPEPAPWVNQWWNAEEKTLNNMEAWSQGKGSVK